MDPLSVSASIIAVVGIAGKIISACKAYISTLRDAPDDLRTIFVNISSLKAILETIDFFVVHGANKALAQNFQVLAGPDSPIEGCRQRLADLEELIPQTQTNPRKRKKHRDNLLAQLAWPLKEAKARKLLADIEQYKSSLSLALSADVVYAFL